MTHHSTAPIEPAASTLILKESKAAPTPAQRTRIEELLRKRFFFAPAFSIYGGVAGLYDYGPPGCALQANILALWRNHFILEESMLELDTTILTPHDVLKTSGHVDRFTDYMVKDAVTGDFYRADHLLEARLEKAAEDPKTGAELKAEIEGILAQIDGYGEADLQAFIHRFGLKSDLGNDLTPVVKFNLMFGSDIGPTGLIKGFMRPETAQGQFVNFKRLLECNNERMPFASAQIGKSFRNEISPRAGLLRVREFTMAEIEHYVHPERKEHARFAEVADLLLSFLPRSVQLEGSAAPIRMSVGEAVASGMVNNETLGYFLARTALFLWKIGIKPDLVRFRQHLPNEMAHYASDCWDAEIRSSYGWVECVGCADRAAYDLSMHSKTTGERLVAREKLPEPKQMTTRRLQVNKKEIGIAFKKDAKAIVDALEAMSLCDAEELMSSRTSGSVRLSVNRSEFELRTPAMVELKEVTETVHVIEYIPSVIEPSFGIGRILYSLLEHSYYQRDGDEQRAVFAFPPVIAPVKCLVAPLSQQDVFRPFTADLLKQLRRRGVSSQIDDSGASIGKRYARNDEVGIPFGVTVDFQTVKDSTVTIRERDSTQQVRLPLGEVADTIYDLVEGHLAWPELAAKHGLFTAQDI
jgi:glycyl-tRNA synthetase